MANGIRTSNSVYSIKFEVSDFDKHLKKAGGHISRNIVEITKKMKTLVKKPLMIDTP